MRVCETARSRSRAPPFSFVTIDVKHPDVRYSAGKGWMTGGTLGCAFCA